MGWRTARPVTPKLHYLIQTFSFKAQDDILKRLVLSTTQRHSADCHRGNKPESIHVKQADIREFGLKPVNQS